MNEEKQRLLYDKRTAAALLSISIRSLEYMIAKSEIKVRRLGSRVLVPRIEVEKLARRDVPSPSPAKARA